MVDREDVAASKRLRKSKSKSKTNLPTARQLPALDLTTYPTLDWSRREPNPSNSRKSSQTRGLLHELRNGTPKVILDARSVLPPYISNLSQQLQKAIRKEYIPLTLKVCGFKVGPHVSYLLNLAYSPLWRRTIRKRQKISKKMPMTNLAHCLLPRMTARGRR